MPLPQPHPDLGTLDLLVSVSKMGSISAAARVHYMTQPAASMRLRSLESAVGVRLLERSRRGVRLTPAGIATVEWASAVLREVQTLVTGIAALRADQDSHLHVAASLTVAEYLVPRWLERLARDMPQAKVSLRMGNTKHVIDLVSDGEVEIGFVEGSGPPAQLHWQQVVSDELVIVVGANHPWSGCQDPLSAEELASAPLVLRERGSGTRDVLADALAERGLSLTAAMELGSTTAIKSAVIGGAGAAVVSALAVANELLTGQLVAVPCRAVNLRRVIRAVWVAKRPPTYPARQLLAIITDSRASA